MQGGILIGYSHAIVVFSKTSLFFNNIKTLITIGAMENAMFNQSPASTVKSSRSTSAPSPTWLATLKQCGLRLLPVA